MAESPQTSTTQSAESPATGWRFPVGVTIFVLGGEFWDKLRALFVHGARAVFPSRDGDEGGNDE